MAYFLAVYTMRSEDFAAFYERPKAEQDEIDTTGIKQWKDWETKNAKAIVNRGGMVGKTKRVTRAGIADASNPICGYLIVEAETIDEAALLFEDHPHIGVFPGDGVDIMPFVTKVEV